MNRAAWKAYIKLSLVSIPIQAYTAAKPAREQVALHQLHQGHARIQYHKFCPIHGEVPNDEIVKGFEYSKNEYVVVDPEEIEKIQTEGDRSINLQAFVQPEEIDPLYFSGKSYYLMPDGAAGHKAYGLLAEAMTKLGVFGVATVVVNGRQQLVVLRPVEHVLTISGLEFKTDMRDVSEFTEDKTTDYSTKELQLTEALIEATTQEDFDVGQFHDEYEKKLHELIDAKVAGKEIKIIPNDKPRTVINMMDALRESIAQMKRNGRGKESVSDKIVHRRQRTSETSSRRVARKKA